MKKSLVILSFTLWLAGCAPPPNEQPAPGPDEPAASEPEKQSAEKPKKRQKMNLDVVANRPNLPATIKERIDIIRDAEIDGADDNGPVEGTEAPDFELMPLKFYDFKIDSMDITEENAGELYRPVRLSEFRGNKPVVLIFGSYT